MTSSNGMQTLWLDLSKRLLYCPVVPSRAGDTREIVGAAYVLNDPLHCWAGGSRLEKRGSLGYGYAELLWYLSGVNTLDMLGAYAPTYKNYTNDGHAMGAYGFRWLNNPGIFLKNTDGSLITAIELLKTNKDDRRAVVAMWDSGDIHEAARGVWKDIPCTLNLQMLVREGKLNMIATMRSNDHWLGGIYDPFTFCQIQILVASALKLDIGKYYHRAGSYHLYTKNEAALRLYIEGDGVPSEFVSPRPIHDEAVCILYNYKTSHLARAEEYLRNNQDDIIGALAMIPEDFKWSATALKALHYHLNRSHS